MLDPSTIRLEHAILQAFSTFMTFANWRINRVASGMQWFFFYNLALLTGTSLAFFRYRLSPLYSVVLSNLLFATAYFFLFLVVTQLFGRGKRQVSFQFGLLLLCVVTMLQYGYFAPDLRKRIVAFSVVIGLQQMHSAFLLRPRWRASALEDSGGPLAAMLVCLAIANGVRILAALSPAGTAIGQSAQSIYAVIEIINTCLHAGTIVAYVWITAAMLRHDLEVQASTDPLTGLMNRRAFERYASQELIRQPSLITEAAVITMDLDGFKQINDTLGHACGDDTLMAVAASLRAGLRSGDLAARLGGDEFAVLLPRTPLQVASTIAQRLCDAIAMIKIPCGQATASVTASIGLAPFQTPQADWDHTLTHCDQALYAAKRAGGNRVVYIADPLTETVTVGSLTKPRFDFTPHLPYN